ncbi:MAG: alpha/beta hydrolase [Candidatus Omnitrophica bacterium]|nr:alpha/beta hydrolase [Candidatus Omnitrophota bacterium]
MFSKNKYLKSKILLLLFVLFSLCSRLTFADTLSWKDENTYKPYPILFLHGFALGNSDSWNYIKSQLNQYFNDYSLTPTFLETINFNDPNGSIDTYNSGKFNPDGNSQGWADKVKIKMDGILSNYYFKGTALKVNIVCHSMGGLAAREYITNPKYSCDTSKIDKLITIGTPHAGSPLGNIKKEIIGSINKYIVEYPPLAKVTCKASLSVNSDGFDLLLGKNKIDINGEALKDMAYGSNFLHVLNYQRSQPGNIKKYAICGWFNNVPLWNFAIFWPFYSEKTNYDFNKLSDLVVPYDSQRGYDIITNYPQENWVWQPDNILEVNADHMHELENPNTVNYILRILDSVPPEFTLDDPAANSTTEIYTTSISIKGRVFKEYLPADSQLIITGVRQEDGNSLNELKTYLKPSSLWIPNNPDSPVAEFNETISFPGQGTYKISCQIQNPAGLLSDTKIFWIKVMAQSNANIIVHCHNPEGKEINSIVGVGNATVIYDGDTQIGYGTHDTASHNQLIAISSGTHTIKVKFNGVILEQDVYLQPNQTQVLIFVFTRNTTSITLPCFEHEWTMSGSGGPGTFNIGITDNFGTFGAECFLSNGSSIYGSMSITVSISGSESGDYYLLQKHLISYFSSAQNSSADTIRCYTLNPGINIMVPVPGEYINWFVQGQLTNGGAIWGGARLAHATRQSSNWSSPPGHNVLYPITGYYIDVLAPGSKAIDLSNIGDDFGVIGYPSLWDAKCSVEYLKAGYISSVPYDLNGTAV